MLISLKEPAWHKECQAIHDFMQGVLAYVEGTAKFERPKFDADDSRKAYTGRSKEQSVIAGELEKACGVANNVKTAFRQAHATDRLFSGSSGSFQFFHHKQDIHWPEETRTLMIESFQAVLGKGTRGFRKVPGLGDHSPINRDWIWDAYCDANGKTCCPYCGNFMPVRFELDHFFPKHEYPTLAVMLSNLVPTCNCNSKYKSVADPLEAAVTPGAITNVCLPYSETSLAQQMALRFYRAKVRKGKWHQVNHKVEVTVADNATDGAKLAAFIRLTNLSTVWSDALHMLQQQLHTELRPFRQQGTIAGPADVKEAINDLAKLSTVDLRSGGYMFLRSHYFRWLAGEQDECDNFWGTVQRIPITATR